MSVDKPAKRRDLRVPVRVRVRTQDGRENPEYAINVSTTGICVQSPRARTQGEFLDLTIPLGEQPDLCVRAEVVWCTPDEHRAAGLRFYEIGLRFVEIAPEAQRTLLAFAHVEELQEA